MTANRAMDTIRSKNKVNELRKPKKKGNKLNGPMF